MCWKANLVEYRNAESVWAAMLWPRFMHSERPLGVLLRVYALCGTAVGHPVQFDVAGPEASLLAGDSPLRESGLKVRGLAPAGFPMRSRRWGDSGGRFSPNCLRSDNRVPGPVFVMPAPEGKKRFLCAMEVASFQTSEYQWTLVTACALLLAQN
jgi:hypothetical protein